MHAAHARAVVITGCGVVSPLGDGLQAFDAALYAGRSALRGEALDLPGQDPAQVPLARAAFDAARVRAPSRLPADRGTAMALATAAQATQAARLDTGAIDTTRLGVYWGSGMGGACSFDATCEAVYAHARRMRPTAVVTTMPNAPLAEVALLLHAHGAAIGHACACASAAVAIGEAMRALRDGRLDVVVAGGSEALLSPGVIGAWQAMRVLAPAAPGDAAAGACRPFGADRAGFGLGEGAAALVLETAEHARARGARPLALLSGYGGSCDAAHMTQPDTAGQQRAIVAALRDAGLRPSDIGHVNAHGTATQAGDAAEAASLRAVFGDRPPPVSATKAVLGHLLGAGGAVELVATLCALLRQSAPAVPHMAEAEAALGIDLVCGQPRPLPGLAHALSNSFAFGGTNAVLVLSRAA